MRPKLTAKIDERTPAEIKALQIVFQNPDSALNRSRSVKSLIGRALAKLFTERERLSAESGFWKTICSALISAGLRPSILPGRRSS